MMYYSIIIWFILFYNPQTTLNSTLQGFLVEDTLGDTALLDKAWRGAEAYHLLLLTQRQFYSKDPETSLKTVSR